LLIDPGWNLIRWSRNLQASNSLSRWYKIIITASWAYVLIWMIDVFDLRQFFIYILSFELFLNILDFLHDLIV